MEKKICPLCQFLSDFFYKDTARNYYKCTNCSLVFVLPEEFVSIEEEKAVYELHQNSPEDQGYRNFLSRILEPMVQRISLNSVGLDFGCGPGPTLSIMFEEKGYQMKNFDPFFCNETKNLNQNYDFITSTEVLEHLRKPFESLNKVWGMLRNEGYLGIMTKMVINKESFKNWHYKNDETHICFFSKKTFAWLGELWDSKPIFLGSDVILFKK